MPVFNRSKSLLTLKRLFRYLGRQPKVYKAELEKIQFHSLARRLDCHGHEEGYDLVKKLQEGDALYIVNLPGSSQEEVNDMINTLRNVLEPKPNTVTLLLGHKEVHLITQGKGRPKSVVLQLVKNYGFKIRKNEHE